MTNPSTNAAMNVLGRRVSPRLIFAISSLRSHVRRSLGFASDSPRIRLGFASDSPNPRPNPASFSVLLQNIFKVDQIPSKWAFSQGKFCQIVYTKT